MNGFFFFGYCQRPSPTKIPVVLPQDIVIRILLLPFALLYGLVVGLRNYLYRVGVLRSVRFSLPVISVGNLSVGGAGKSPHIEYLMGWLHQYIDVAVLSRGYGRSTSGFRQVLQIDRADMVGDEPLQMKRKYPEVPVVVSESRILGIPALLRQYPGTQCVLLDDAFQHLAISPGLNILLTEYNRPFTRDWLLPSGRLREWRQGYRRADVIIVTKCPPDMDEQARNRMISEIDPYPRQRIYCSQYTYGRAYDLLRPDLRQHQEGTDTEVLLVSAIANTDYLIEHLVTQYSAVHTLEFEDHHYFAADELLDIKRRFEAIKSPNKIILTTEKDATRLELHRDFFWQNNLPVWVLPVEVAFCGEDEALFQEDVRRFLLDFKV